MSHIVIKTTWYYIKLVLWCFWGDYLMNLQDKERYGEWDEQVYYHY